MPKGMGLARVFRVCLVLVGIGYGAWHLYNHLLQPEAIKQRVCDAFAEKFEGVDVEVGSAHLRPFLGGINVSDLKFIRQDDPTRTPFLQISSAIIWHDKAEMARQIGPAKIELDEVRCHLIRNAEGKWNVEGIQKKKRNSNPSPLMVIKKAHVDVLDEATNHRAQLDLKDLEVTVVNDPVSTFTVEAKGTSHPIGPFVAKLKYEVDTLATGSLELKGIKLGDDLTNMIGMAIPEAGVMAKPLSGLANARVRFAWKPNHPIQYESDFNLTDGRYQLPNNQSVLEDMKIALRSKNGNLIVDTFTARLDKAAISAKVEIDGPGTKEELPIEDRLRKVSVVINGLMVNEELFKMLPPNCASVREMFSPQGRADILFEQSQEADGFQRTCTVRPQGMSASYRGFVYPIDNLFGSVEATFKKDKSPVFLVKLHGEGSGNPVYLEGTIIGSNDDEDHVVDLVLKGEHVNLDEMLIKALPNRYPNFVRSLHATATGDFTAKLRHNPQTRRDHGPDVFDNEFLIQIRQGTMNYDEFKYPLSQIKGTLLIRTVPDHPTIQPDKAAQPGMPDQSEEGSVRFENFTARGPGGCELEIKGSKEPNSLGMALKLDIKGERVPLNQELQRAISSLRLDSTWTLFDPSATMNCIIQVQIQDYPGREGEPPPAFHPARDLELKLAFNGPTLKPTFFDYQLTDCQGKVKFEKGVVTMWDFQARHGLSTIKLPNTVVQLPKEPGKYYADLWNVSVDPLQFDSELLSAMPKGLRQACQEMEFKGPFAIHAKRLHVSNTSEPKRSNTANDRLAREAKESPTVARGSIPTTGEFMPTIAWDGTLYFRNAGFRTGIEWKDVTGQYSSEGIFLGDRLGPVKSILAIEKAKLLKQPIEKLSAHFEVDPNQPEIVTIPWIRAQMYGGQIGGEARLQLDSPLRFDLSLNGSRMRLEEFAKVNQLGPKSQVEGLANAQIMLSNPIDPKTKKNILQGSGSLDIPEGKLLDLPAILDVLKLARLRPMDRTMFEEAHAIFRIRGDRIRFGQLDLIGNALSLGGEGEMNLNGSDADFEFYTVWTNVRNILGVSGEIPSRVSSNLYKIRVSGDLGDGQPKVSREPLPLLMDPVKRLLGQHRP